MEVVDTGNPHIFSFVRHHEAGRVLVLANFSESEQTISANEVRLYGLGYNFLDLITGEHLRLQEDIVLAPYRFMWLAPS
jgi:amylosucrase